MASPAAPPPCELSVQLALTSTVPRGVRATVNGPVASQYTVIATAPKAPPIVRTAASLDRLDLVFMMPMVTEPAPFDVAVFATYGSGSEAVSCRAAASIVNPPAPRLQAVGGRVIIPAAGSASGAYGGRFRTSLRLTGFGTGRIYFRREGTFFGDERDPYLAYDLGPNPFDGPHATVYFDDVVGAMSESGIGNLDIVPDLYPVVIDAETRLLRFAPEVDARVYHDAPIGRFGSPVEPLSAQDLFVPIMQVPIPLEMLATARINIGIRTFDERVPIAVASFSYLGGLVPLPDFEMAPNTFRQFPLAELMGREPTELDAALILYFSGRPVALYYSVTENSTNDPTVVVNAVRQEKSGDITAPVIPERQ